MAELPVPADEEGCEASCSRRGFFVGVSAGSGQGRFCSGVTGSAEAEVEAEGGGLGGRAPGVATEKEAARTSWKAAEAEDGCRFGGDVSAKADAAAVVAALSRKVQESGTTMKT